METENIKNTEPSKNTNSKKTKSFIKPIIFVSAFCILIGGLYISASSYYKTHFFNNTYINDEDFSGCTSNEVLRKLNLNENSQVFKLIGKDGSIETIKCKDFDYTTSAKDELDTLISEQNPYDWIKTISLFGGMESDYKLNLDVSYDDDKLKDTIYSLDCVINGTQPSQDATIQFGSDGYYIQKEIIGNIVDKDKLYTAVKQCLKDGQMQLNLSDGSCYQLPNITSDNPNLQVSLDKIKLLENVVITYDFKDRTEVLDKEKIKNWITIDESGQTTLNEESVALYVSQLAYKYDTYLTDREFTTTAGNTITVGGGIYGWKIDKEKETEALSSLILSGTSETREPIYYIKGYERGTDDIGNTYVEIDLTKQHLWYYKKGELFLETDVVTGYPYNGHSTPTGVFCIWSREKDRYLTGETYNTHVDYWMPINWDGVGLHDAWWQTSFGGEIYKTPMGSHGCINLPTDIAASIYQNSEVGTPVIIYES